MSIDEEIKALTEKYYPTPSLKHCDPNDESVLRYPEKVREKYVANINDRYMREYERNMRTHGKFMSNLSVITSLKCDDFRDFLLTVIRDYVACTEKNKENAEKDVASATALLEKWNKDVDVQCAEENGVIRPYKYNFAKYCSLYEALYRIVDGKYVLSPDYASTHCGKLIIGAMQTEEERDEYFRAVSAMRSAKNAEHSISNSPSDAFSYAVSCLSNTVTRLINRFGGGPQTMEKYEDSEESGRYNCILSVGGNRVCFSLRTKNEDGGMMIGASFH